MKKMLISLLVCFSINSSFSQVTSQAVSFETIRKVILTGDTILLLDSLKIKGFNRLSNNSWSGQKISVDSLPKDLFIDKYFKLEIPYIQFWDMALVNPRQRYFYYLFSICDLQYYLSQALSTVNKNKVKSYIWAYNTSNNKDNSDETTVLHFYPEKYRNEDKVDTEIYIRNEKVLLIMKYINYENK